MAKTTGCKMGGYEIMAGPSWFPKGFNAVVHLSNDDMKTLRKHYYGDKAFTTDSMLDLYHDIVEQILGER